MKRLLSILLFVFLSECLNAKPIEQETALKVATNFLRLKMPNSGLSQLKGAKLEIDLKLIKTFYKSNELKKASNNKEEVTPCVYIFSDLNKAGFVITSAEISMPPIIGYSYENNIDSNNLPPQLVAIIERWIEITSDPELNINNPENSRIWEDLLYIDSVKTIPDNQNNVEPLIKTKWGQGQFYNDLCPTIEGKKSPVGCVATAVAQLMKYWNYPEYGSGSTNYNVYDQNVAVNFGITKYDWENMPLMVTSPNSAVATLCYHVGAALNMGYGPNQSESTDYSVTLALRNNFNYGPMKYFNNYQGLERLSDYESKIKSELFAGRPVLFSGSNGTIGHTYLCDGMQEDFFHLNYGWDGNSDGFYNLSTEMKFNKNLSLIYEIKPSKMHISERNPMVGESISVNFLVDHSKPIWSISPKENVKIEIDATNSNLINLSFIKMGIYKISLLELNGNDTTYLEENNISVSFPTYKGLEPIRGSYACGQSWPDRWFDYDNDGDLDLFCGYSSYVFENAKGNFVKRYPFSNTYNGSFQVFDYNNDTFLDIVSSETTYIDGKYGLTAFIYKNLKGLGFQKQTIVLPNLGGGGIIPSDFNNDGLIDLFIYGYDYNDNGNPTDEFMGKPKTYILINKNEKFEKIYEGRLSKHFRSENMATANDFDNDGDIDLIIRSNEDTCLYLKNGIGQFAEKYLIKPGIRITSGDIDNNGTIDLISSPDTRDMYGYTHGMIHIGYNTEGLYKEKVEYVKSGFNYNRLGMADFNADGRTDLYVTSEYSTEYVIFGFNVFLNGNEDHYNYVPPLSSSNNQAGNGLQPETDDRFSYIPDIYSMQMAADADCGDFNNDGFPDIAIGSSILINAYGNRNFTNNTPPTAPDNLIASGGNNKVTLTWNRATDEQTPSRGLSYNLMLGTTYGGIEIISPMSNPITGKRNIVAMGNVFQNTSFEIHGLKPGKYYWSVQAIDNSYMGGKFAPYNSFEIKADGSLNTIDINKAPVANAGIDQSIYENETVTLDGTASVDPEGSTITYFWTAPAGISLSSITVAKPTFTAPEVAQDTPYTFSLVVSDGTANSTVDKVVITVKNVNKVPVANAGPDQTVNEGITINLDGSASTDPDGLALTYQWTAPTGISLNSNTIAKPSFTSPEVIQDTPYTFSLVVSDGTANSTVDQVVITVKNVNKAPVANAGPDQTVNEGAIVMLNGSASSDPDNDLLVFKWMSPKVIVLNNSSVAKPIFIAPEVKRDTTYSISLIVNDGKIDSPSSTMKINVLNVVKVSTENLEQPAFLVYPNPTRGEITIEITRSNSSSGEITLLNSVGSIVLKKKITHQEPLGLDLSELVNGLYLIKLDISDQKYLCKILLQK